MALNDKLVVLTRAHEDNRALRERLEQAGVAVLEVPTAQFGDVPLPPEQRRALPSHDALTFASAHAVAAFARQLSAAEVQEIAATIGAVGQTTARALERIGLPAAVVAQSPSTGQALAELLIARLPARARVLVVQARQSQPELMVQLRAAGLDVEVAVVYENVEPHAPSSELLRRAAQARAIYLAAPSAADRLLAWAPDLRDRPLVAIGATTATALRDKHGVPPAAQAASPDLADVTATLLTFCA